MGIIHNPRQRVQSIYIRTRVETEPDRAWEAERQWKPNLEAPQTE